MISKYDVGNRFRVYVYEFQDTFGRFCLHLAPRRYILLISFISDPSAARKKKRTTREHQLQCPQNVKFKSFCGAKIVIREQK